MSQAEAKAVLVTGVYGTGKSSVVEEIADIFEKRRTPYAALDLDWLAWFDAGWDDDEAEFQMMLRNLEAVVANYLSADIRFFAMALSIESESELEAIRGRMPMPVNVVRLTVPLETIRERLGSAVTSGREVDLHWAELWLEDGTGAGPEDFTIANDRPIREVAMEIMTRLDWI